MTHPNCGCITKACCHADWSSLLPDHPASQITIGVNVALSSSVDPCCSLRERYLSSLLFHFRVVSAWKSSVFSCFSIKIWLKWGFMFVFFSLTGTLVITNYRRLTEICSPTCRIWVKCKYTSLSGLQFKFLWGFTNICVFCLKKTEPQWT